MTLIPGTIAERIQAQGFCGFEEKLYAEINYPLRLSPAICMTWVAVGIATQSANILWALVPFALLGAILPGHPFDVIYNYGLRFLFDKPALPPYGVRRRLACLMASIMISAAALEFQFGNPIAASIIGWTLAGMAFVNVVSGFCVPSFVFRILFGKVDCGC